MEKIENEEWRDIAGYEGLYQVSNLGRVKSLNYNKTKKEKILKANNNRDGYLGVELYKERKGKRFQVHRLVAQAFIPNPLNLPQVNHINEDKTLNAVENLEWSTAEYNLNYGTRTERSAKARSKAVLQYSLDGLFIREFPSTIEVERQFGFIHSYISQCCNGKYKQAYGFIWRYK